MTVSSDKQKQLHFDVSNVGLRAQATAVGFVQLCLELQRANVLTEPAIERIKDAIADEVSVNAPRSFEKQQYRDEIRARLDRLLAREEEVGSAEALAFGATPDTP